MRSSVSSGEWECWGNQGNENILAATNSTLDFFSKWKKKHFWATNSALDLFSNKKRRNSEQNTKFQTHFFITVQCSLKTRWCQSISTHRIYGESLQEPCFFLKTYFRSFSRTSFLLAENRSPICQLYAVFAALFLPYKQNIASVKT